MYHLNLVPRMALSESLSLYHQVPNLGQIRKSEIHNIVMNVKILKNYILINKGVSGFFLIF